ncbi:MULTISPECIES: FtsX-like permease family protein [unclassified Granulicatella]|uniref:ABC transporter permease n=1 Tax=unclassified Granulicatella TaxID=2630493 RepID=UPI00142FB2A1|nr:MULTISPECIES: FtsX-like permease family protein [unclassified Granulicatella]MBF0780902.1 FtsX-like permease family protein [Granulicatella sp. 19428wC4_WM01]
MKKITLYKDMKRAITSSIGRFLSIASLMGLGAFGLSGLQSTSPDIDATVQEYVTKTQLADLFVIGSYGLDEYDQAELQKIAKKTVEFGYFTDTIIASSTTSIRVFSNPKTLSKPDLIAGDLPKTDNEIALSASFQKQYALGDTITLHEKESSTLLKTHTFTITGFTQSSEFLSQTNLGPTKLGSGILNGYAFVSQDAFHTSVYTIARFSFDEATHHTFSKSYTDKVIARQKEIENLLNDNAAPRLERIKSEAKDKINKGLQEISDAEQKLNDGKKQLDDSLQIIQDNQNTLDQQQDNLNIQENTLSVGKAQLDETLAKLIDTRQQLDEAKVKIDKGENTLQQKKEELDTAEKTLIQVDETLRATKSYLDKTKIELQNTFQALQQNKEKIDADKLALQQNKEKWQQDKELLETQPDLAKEQGITLERLHEQKKQLDVAQEQVNQEEHTYDISLKLYQEREQEYPIHFAAYQSGLDNYTKNTASFQQGKQEYQEALTSFQNQKDAYQLGLTTYQNGVDTYEQSLRDYQTGVEQVNQGKEKLQQALSSLQQARQDWQQKQDEFQQKQDSANQEISDQKQTIVNAQRDLNHLTLPTYQTYTRSTMLGSEGYTVISATSKGIESVGRIFPVVLYAVAALVTLTTMTRFVNEERTNSGVLKALGYHSRDIMKKFIIYGLVAGMTGTLLGILVGVYILPILLGKALLSQTILPPILLKTNWSIIGLTLCCAFICSVLPSIIVAKRELKDHTSTLLMHKVPVSGSKILLEYLPCIWKRLSFTQKVTARNIFRYKLRMFMTIFGVAGSITLLFSGLGIISSLQNIAHHQYKDIIQYQLLILEQENIKSEEKEDIQRLLHSQQVKQFLPIHVQSFKKAIPSVNDLQTITLLASNTPFDEYITLKDRKTNVPLHLSKDGVIITDKLANLLQVNEGDTFTLEKNNHTYTLRVSGIAEWYAGHNIFIQPSTYQQIFGKSVNYSNYLITLSNPSKENIQKLTSDFLLLSGVSTAIHQLISLEQINAQVSALTQVMSILLVTSILLVVIILYNLNNINVNERIRELSTIKVLGFYTHEITFYIYRETIMLSIIGIVCGIFCGQMLHRLIIDLVSTPVIMFSPNVDLWVYLIPIVSIIILLSLLGALINRYLKRINMLDALKAID